MNNRKMINMKNKGFTLIELLAIIVILAIIAVITTPLILGVIDESRNKSMINSAYGFKDAVDKYYVTTIEDNQQKLDGMYIVRDGIIDGPTVDTAEIPISGNKPSNGYLIYNNNKLQNACLAIDEYEINYSNGKFDTANKGDCASIDEINTENMTLGIKEGNIQYYTGNRENLDNEVFFDPINGIYNCTTYNETNSELGYNGTNATGNQTSCLRWFVYSIDDKGTETELDDTVNMILDHNITSEVHFTAEIQNNSYVNYNGPSQTYLSQLKSDTDGWISSKIIAPKPYTASWDYDKNGNSIIDEGEHHTYTIAYENYKARSIEANEVARIKGNTLWNYTDSSVRDIITVPNEFLQSNTSSETPYGYWTVTPTSWTARRGWAILYDSGLYSGVVEYDLLGIRPVISIYKKDIL